MTYSMQRFGLPVLKQLCDGGWPNIDCVHIISDTPIAAASLFHGQWWGDVKEYLTLRKSEVDWRRTRLILDVDFVGNVKEEAFLDSLDQVDRLVGHFTRR